MSILSWLLKPKSKMAEKNTKPVKILKYTLSSHAQNRVKERSIPKKKVVGHLLTRPLGISDISIDESQRKSYSRVGKFLTSSINPDSDTVCTIRVVSKKDAKTYGLVKKKGRKYAKVKKTD